MFRKVLIANRGEIAVRIIRACRELGIRTVAVYSEADRDAMHVQLADEAVCIGPAPSVESYLNIPHILMAAHITGAEAIHPGYGYLSERSSFAEACAAQGIKFIGPPPDAIAKMGDKSLARQIAQRAGAPVLPGTEHAIQTEDEAVAAARRIGYPLLIKAAAGGGGRGIRRVMSEDDLLPALRIAQSEAQAAFGSSDVYLEKYIPEPRHVEVQILADEHGKVLHLYERECSVQTPRHQKMIEEAPAPNLKPETRAALGEAAVKVAQAVGYQNAGTVEFLVDSDENFYFIEMNTRLQVEHPVTEAITGIDIVQWQIRIAAGEPLPFEQHEIPIHGHAIEARLTAEIPERDFTPSTGRISEWTPPGGPGVRVDSHLYTGYGVPPYYDPLLAKIIVHAPTRAMALARLERALQETRIAGVHTCRDFLLRIVRTDEFRKGLVSTPFVPRLLRSDLMVGGVR
ncbi:MAG: acetyl-CoA carboxylase biotin carboxylase subunit [Fimbriimonadales bacterium]|nr:acetyl-CoA carboxylase biotin carboxylase subunit [Fimbriimonadales bacterium]MDW8051286.1 acetyl-CoA carboxylase biotin carboxylase subunit [Armatimonadota bacterium]